MTKERLFNGIRYDDLPVVYIQCRIGNTLFQAADKNGEQLEWMTPKDFGFFHSAKRSDVAAQITGLNMGQRLRNQNINTVRVAISGFNRGRIAGIRGIVQAGLQVVSITDVTHVDWAWTKRAKKPKRQN